MKTIAYEDLSANEVKQAADDNHIWLNAFSCINPSEEFKAEVGGMILEKLKTTDLRATKLLNGEAVGNLIVVKVNKS